MGTNRNNTVRVSRFHVFAAFISMACTAGRVQAANDTWLNAVDGFFDVDTAWTDGSAPTTADSATFGVAGMYTVLFDDITGDPIILSLSVTAGDVTFANVTSPDDPRVLALSPMGALSITGGSLRLLGGDSNRKMTLVAGAESIIDGGGLIVDVNSLFDGSGSNLIVGNNGIGGLSVLAGGEAKNSNGFVGRNDGSGGTATVDGASAKWTNSGGLTIGGISAGMDSTGFGILNVQAGGVVTNTDGVLGASLGSTGTATVTGAGSQWNSSGGLTVGGDGAGTLSVLDGGVVTNAGATVGNWIMSMGTATVNGMGSRWTSSGTLAVGGLGAGTLNVEAGGVVESTNGILGQSSGGSSGTATVTGAGSQWNNSGELTVGNVGTGTLSVLDGGVVTNTNGRVGSSNGPTGTVNVGGMGSLWDNSGNLQVGVNGHGTLHITAGGRVKNTIGVLGKFAGSTGTATVDGIGSQWINSGFFAIGDIGVGMLTITNGGYVESVGSRVGDALGMDKGSGMVIVDGAGSRWIDTSEIIVGYAGAASSLGVTAGGYVESPIVRIGALLDPSEVTAIVNVDGADSKLKSLGDLVVGSFSGTSTLKITNGGSVENVDGFISRQQPGGNPLVTFNLGMVTVENSGSTWANSGSLYVGGDSSSEGGEGVLTIQDGGKVTVAGMTKIWGPGTMIVNRGPGKVNLNGGMLTTGSLDNTVGGVLNHSGGTLMIDGGTYAAPDSTYSIDGVGNPTLVLDNGAMLDLGANDLLVGDMLSGTLNITAGGMVQNAGGQVGVLSGSTGTVNVGGVGSLWNNSGGLTVGNVGAGTLNVLDGGVVTNADGVLGAFLGSTGTGTVNGMGSQWKSTGTLVVGDLGAGTLNVEAGGVVESAGGILGHQRLGGNAGSGTGTATVTGAGSLWQNSSDLSVGTEGTGELNITAGGKAADVNGLIGGAPGGDGTVNVGGAGSLWDHFALYVGYQGTGTLNITAGGRVQNQIAQIGREISSQGNVVVGGENAVWDNGLFLDVGQLGTGTLSIHGGGTVNVGQLLTVGSNGTVNLDGGTLNIGAIAFPGSTFNFNSGTLRFTSSALLDSTIVSKVFGPGHAITAAQNLIVTNTATLGTALTLDGGTFTAGSVVNGSFLSLNKGTFNLTSEDLTVGPTGQFGDTLALDHANLRVNVSNNTVVENGGILLLRAGLLTTSGQVLNLGRIELDGVLARSAGGTLTNLGLISGRGQVGNSLVNIAGGEVRANFTDALRLTGTGNVNHGLMNINFGGTIESPNGLFNSVTGAISGDGVIRTGQLTYTTDQNGVPTPSGTGLINEGKMLFSGTAKIFGDVWHRGGDSTDIIVSGGAVLTFFDDVFIHDTAPGASKPEIRAGAGSRIVYFGLVKGNLSNTLTGSGIHQFEFGISPGFSPGFFLTNSAIELSEEAMLSFDLSGLLRMDENAEDNNDRANRYGAFDFRDSLTLLGDAVIDVNLKGIFGNNGPLFVPKFGDTFDLIRWARFQGDTSLVNFDFTNAPLSHGLQWEWLLNTSAGGGLTLRVVPEPTSLVMLLLGGVVLGGRRRVAYRG